MKQKYKDRVERLLKRAWLLIDVHSSHEHVRQDLIEVTEALAEKAESVLKEAT